MRAQQESEGLAPTNLNQMYSVCIYGMRMVYAFLSLGFDTMMCGRVVFFPCTPQKRHPDVPLTFLLNAYKSIAIKQNAGFDKTLTSHMYQAI